MYFAQSRYESNFSGVWPRTKESSKTLILDFVTGIARFCVLRQLVDLKASQIFIKLLVQLSSREVLMSDAVLNELIWALGQLSQKGKSQLCLRCRKYETYFSLRDLSIFADAKFAAKVRHFNALPAFHAYLKIFYQHDCKLILPLLMIIKTMAKNSKCDFIATMAQLFWNSPNWQNIRWQTTCNRR